MRRAMLPTLTAALFLGVCSSRAAPAESSGQMKPLAVVSLAGYDELLGNVELAGRLAGRPKLAKGFQGMLAVLTQGKGLAGLDKTRPWGIVIQTDGSRLGGYAFLPVDDLDGFRELVEPYVRQIEDLGDGDFRVQGKAPWQVAFLRQKGNRWLFVCDEREGLASTPDDPAEVLDGLHEQYALAVRLNVGNVPEDQRNKLIAKIRRDAARELERQPDEDEHEYVIRKMLVTKMVAVARAVVEDLETVTLGWSLNDDTHGAYLDAVITAKGGSKTANALGRLSEAKTEFAGFRLPGAILAGRATASCPYAASADLDELYAAIRAKADQQIDAEEPSAERAKIGKEIAGTLLQVAQQTAATGRLDGAMSLVPKAGAITMVAGRNVAGGQMLDEAFRKLVDAIRKQYPAQADQVLKTDVDELRGIRFHSFSMDVPPDAENRDDVVRLFGERVDLVVGIAEDRVCLATGSDALETLKQAIEQSDADRDQPVSPMELGVDLGEVARFVAESRSGQARQRAAKALAVLDDYAHKDHVKLTATAVENGVALRLELEEGVLRVIEAMQE